MSRQAASLVPVEEWHVRDLLSDLREADRLELEALRGWTAEEELREAVRITPHARTCIAEGQVIAIFGDSRHDEFIGIPWMVSSNAITRHARAFLACCYAVIQDMRTRHCYLVNFADTRNNIAIRWLKWCGFEFFNAIPYGRDGELFHPFMMEGTACADQQQFSQR